MNPGERPLDPDRGPDEAELARLRNLLRVDRDGTFVHDGIPVTHRRTVRALVEHMELDPDGRCVVRFGRVWSYVAFDDTPLVVRGVVLPDDPDDPEATVGLVLTGGVEDRLDPGTLRVGDDDAMYCRVRDGRFEARFLRAAHFRLATFVVDRSPGPFELRLAGRSWPIPARTGGEERPRGLNPGGSGDILGVSSKDL